MEEAIKKAIKGGYTTFTWQDVQDGDGSDVLLDPAFWQCLGKSLGWNEVHYIHCPAIDYHGYSNPGECTCSARYEWKAKWHSFIDHLASGEDADSFFKELLTQ